MCIRDRLTSCRRPSDLRSDVKEEPPRASRDGTGARRDGQGQARVLCEENQPALLCASFH
eukprot:8164588-Lingulodinium_polyedra.AAC.1